MRRPKKAEKKPKPAPPQVFPEDRLFLDLLYRVAGEQGLIVAKTLFGKELTDEDLAKRVGTSINLVRRILYELYDNRVVSYRRVRDEDSGWYIYYWKMEPGRAITHLKDSRRQLLQKLEEKLEQERGTMYFVCSNGDPKVPFEEAAEINFKCPRCGKKLERYDNSSVVLSLERRVQLLKQQIT